MKLILGVLPLAFVASACGAKVEPTGTVVFRFTVNDTVKNSPALKSPLNGSVYGAVYLQEDVAVDGPRKDATQYASVAVDAVDLRTATTSDASFTSGKLPVGKYVFLGFFDVNGNGLPNKDPDSGDPATLALTNKFEITDGAQTKRVVVFELVYN